MDVGFDADVDLDVDFNVDADLDVDVDINLDVVKVLGGDSVALVHNVEIISPPGVPTISGVQPHSSVQVLLNTKWKE